VTCKKPLILACDTSDYGIGAVLSHIVDEQQEKLMAYIFLTLSAAEKNYSQLEEEALAVIFAVIGISLVGILRWNPIINP